MAKDMEKKGVSSWSVKDWCWAAVSEVALFLFLWDFVRLFGLLYGPLDALLLWALLNIALFACPAVRKHYLS